MSQRSGNTATSEPNLEPTLAEPRLTEPALAAQSDGSPADTSVQTTTVMGFQDLEDFRQAARDAEDFQTEADRVTPTAPLVSPFADSPPDQPSASPHATESAPKSPPSLPAWRSHASAAMRNFREASWPKRATVLLLPIVIGLYGVKAFRRGSLPPNAPARPVASAAAATSVSRASVIPTVTPSSNAAPARGALPTPEPHSPGLTLERRAVDAYADGNFQEAAALYQRLAAQNPGSPAYAAASQIASDKAKGAAHD